MIGDDDFVITHLMMNNGKCVISVNGEGHLPCSLHRRCAWCTQIVIRALTDDHWVLDETTLIGSPNVAECPVSPVGHEVDGRPPTQRRER